MIPLPPPDPGLPDLPIAFDGGMMAEVLTSHLPDCVDGQFTVASCRPCYVRYKPGTNCVVEYELVLRDAGGSTIELPAHIYLYADNRAARRWSKTRLHDLVESAARHHAVPPLGRAAHLPELRALAYLYPVDYGLPALVRASAACEVRLALQPTLPEGIGRLTDAAPSLVRYKPSRKALLRFPLAGGSLDAVYVKLLTDDRGPTLVNLGLSLLAAGVVTPTPLAYCPNDRLLVHEGVPGISLAALAGADAFDPWMEPVAAALAGVQRTDLTGLPEHRLSDEATTIQAAARAIGGLVPELAPRLERLAAAVAKRLMDIPEKSVPVHGDFYYDQALVSEAGVVLIDFDEARRGHPLLDVGTFLAHLSAAGRRGILSPAGARAAFQTAYAQLQPASYRDVALFEAAALVRLAGGPFRRLESDWPEVVERLVELSERRLSQSEAGQPVTGTGVPGERLIGSDPALPQLERLRDPKAMTPVLRRALGGEPIEVHAIEVVRHKPGRRCLLRYDLAIGEPDEWRRERFYGKTFASDRGARVHAVTQAIVDAHGFGPAVRLPEQVGYLPHLKLLIQREVLGEPVSSRLLAGDVTLAFGMAEAVHALHVSGLDLGHRHGPDLEFGPLQSRVDQMRGRCPPLAVQAERCLALVEAGRSRIGDWRWCPTHRDCYHEQFLFGSAGLAVLDLDDAAMSEPALDVANVLAHLWLLGLQTRGDPAALAPVATAFATMACRLDPDLDHELLRFLEGATLLRLAAIHLPRSRGEWLAGRLLGEAERLLGGRAPLQ
ncbi:MAG: aminoglycoside phosphotransferase family protein [Chloroflexota bacterium]|nr:aminoglycoside phosphotransferase family protein [Chloroflexota bacterium]